MDTWQRRTVGYLVGLVGIMLGYALLYQYGMAAFEDRPRTFLESLQYVVETFTTTGYGSDAGWSTPEMNVLVILIDITGVVLIFLALPVMLFPLFENALRTTVPTSVPDSQRDHVIICTYSSRADPLIAELESEGVDYVLVVPDKERARNLQEDGYRVIHGNPDTEDGLLRANIGEARALVADVSDQKDASIVLGARAMTEDVKLVSVVENPDTARYHELAGADAVLTPRSLVGQSLANKVTTGLSTELGDAIEIGEDFDVVEFPIHPGSDLVGSTLAESGLREDTGVNVIGAWFDGEFETPPSPSGTLDTGTVLLVTGQERALERAKERTVSETRRFVRGEIVVVGHGEVGETVVQALEGADLPHTVIDRESHEGVDVVGEATDPDVLQSAGVESARSIILAVPDDTSTEFATLVVRDMNEQIEIICRADEMGSMKKMYRAGADYVLSLSNVTGRMVAAEVLEEDVISVDTQVQVVRTTAPALEGQTLEEALVRSRTGCTVVAVERNGDLETNLGPDTRIEPGDKVVVAGTDQGTNRFKELMA
jgi:Trk K+ transport system NAD-binding subunit